MDMEKNKKYTTWIVIIGIICLLGFVESFYSYYKLISTHFISSIAASIVFFTNICVYLTIFYYLFFRYKVPGTKVLTYLMLFFAFSATLKEIIFSFSGTMAIQSVMSTLVCLGSLIVCYISGRLTYVKENRITAVTAMLFFVAQFIIVLFITDNISQVMGNISVVIQWACISGAYFIRYKQCK